MGNVAFLKRLQSHSITPFFTSIHAYTWICPTRSIQHGDWRLPPSSCCLIFWSNLSSPSTSSTLFILESFWVVFPMFKVSCLLLCQEARPRRRRFHIHASKEHTLEPCTVKIPTIQFHCYIFWDKQYEFSNVVIS